MAAHYFICLLMASNISCVDIGFIEQSLQSLHSPGPVCPLPSMTQTIV